MTVSSNTIHDPLTGLPDRAWFETAFADALLAANPENRPVSVAVVDIDLLGRINAVHGRTVGDALIQSTAQRLQQTLHPETRLSRIGGDALAVLFPALEKEQAFLRVEAFRQEFAGMQILKVNGGPIELTVSVSVGVASHPDDGAKAADILNRACEALYRAKVSGRNKVCLAREERMVTKTSHYTQDQLMGLRRLAEREGYGDAALLREALSDLLRKYNA